MGYVSCTACRTRLTRILSLGPDRETTPGTLNAHNVPDAGDTGGASMRNS